jgi:hypothetical protein
MQNDPLRKLYVLRTQGMMAQLQEAHSYCVVCAYSYCFSLFFSVFLCFVCLFFLFFYLIYLLIICLISYWYFPFMYLLLISSFLYCLRS